MTFKEADKLADILYGVIYGSSDLIVFVYDPINEVITQITDYKIDEISRTYTFTLEDNTTIIQEDLIVEYVIVYKQVEDWLNIKIYDNY